MLIKKIWKLATWKWGVIDDMAVQLTRHQDESVTSLKAVYLNVRSLRKHHQQFKHEVKRGDYDVVAATETQFQSFTQTPQLEGYHAFHQLRPKRRQGGISVFVKKHGRPPSLRSERTPTPDFSLLVCASA